MRGLLILGLALAIGFVLYRVALATVPSERLVGSVFPFGCDFGVRSAPHFDALTGLPVPWTCTDGDGESRSLYAASDEMERHWLGSVLVGLASPALALLVMWAIWLRRQVNLLVAARKPIGE